MEPRVLRADSEVLCTIESVHDLAHAEKTLCKHHIYSPCPPYIHEAAFPPPSITCTAVNLHIEVLPRLLWGYAMGRRMQLFCTANPDSERDVVVHKNSASGRVAHGCRHGGSTNRWKDCYRTFRIQERESRSSTWISTMELQQE
eukprot:jgi/Botrbrau1/17642/Bobra.0166s0073.1